MIQEEKIFKYLKGQGYSDRSASLVTQELVRATPSLQPYVANWLGGKEEDYSAHGYSIFGLMKSRKMTYPAALLTIDWLLKEPEKALKSLSQGNR